MGLDAPSMSLGDDRACANFQPASSTLTARLEDKGVERRARGGHLSGSLEAPETHHAQGYQATLARKTFREPRARPSCTGLGPFTSCWPNPERPHRGVAVVSILTGTPRQSLYLCKQ